MPHRVGAAAGWRRSGLAPQRAGAAPAGAAPGWHRTGLAPLGADAGGRRRYGECATQAVGLTILLERRPAEIRAGFPATAPHPKIG